MSGAARPVHKLADGLNGFCNTESWSRTTVLGARSERMPAALAPRTPRAAVEIELLEI
jgi:hypothetical protein